MSKNICNICGANYDYFAGRWKCPACGAFKEEELSNEEITLLYNADQKLRLANFIDAELAFEDIIVRYPKNPAGYWGHLCSCYGIKEEVDFDGRKIPTCYATSIESVLDCKDYKMALSLADSYTKEYYRNQAEYMERVRKVWVEKASKEEPYDIFISYKDSDTANNIERTKDSYEAQNLYTHLIQKGYKVFFSRESLRDKVGEKYEPYIFNALQTSKVMIVYGSSADYINSTWVKNEWSRYLKKINSGEKESNSLIVAYDGFNINELPSILSSKQCLNASYANRDFYPDLDKYINKIIKNGSKEKEPKVIIPEKIEIKKVDKNHKHNFKKLKIISPTCSQVGYTEYACECGEIKKTDFTPRRTTHEFSDWEIIKESSCVKNGIKKRECIVCGYIEEEIIKSIGHTFSDWQVNISDKSKEERICTTCGFMESQSISKSVIQSEDIESQELENNENLDNLDNQDKLKLINKEEIERKKILENYFESEMNNISQNKDKLEKPFNYKNKEEYERKKILEKQFELEMNNFKYNN
ncbi:MAG: TIR domain-containing protein [Clostridia bacterium]|nr:TIR domain-containing protein [Clostridia bacterium]